MTSKILSPIKLTADLPELGSINITNQLIAKEALGRGYSVDFLPSAVGKTGVLVINTNSSAGEVILKSSVVQATAGYGIIIARNKYLAAEIMQHYNLPTPPTKAIDSVDAGHEFLTEHKNIVVKPLDTNHGTGITLGVDSDDKLRQAVAKAQKHSKIVLLQRMVEGTDHRLLVVGNKLAAASKRVPANVIGDGHKSIEELIDVANQDPRRGDQHIKPLTFINKQNAQTYLAARGQKLSDVPAAEQQVFVIGTANLSTGGEAHDITDLVHPKIAQYAIETAHAAGVAVCGVDVITNDISADPDTEPAFIIELNESPGIRMHHFPSKGEPRNVAAAILDLAINYKTMKDRL